MKKVDRYIAANVVVAFLLVLMVLAGLDFVFTLFDQLGDTDEQYQTADAFRYVLLTMPRHLYELLPMSALMGALLGLGLLASHNELVVMQCSGIKAGRIVWAVMKPAVAIMVLGLVLGEYVAPPLEIRAEVNKALASGEEVALSRFGQWQRDGNEFLHFNAFEPEGVMHGVTVYTFDDDRQLLVNTFADRAVFRQEGGERYWRLEDVSETVFERRPGQRVDSFSSEFVSKRWNVDLTPELLRVLIIDADKMAISDLYQYAKRFQSQGQDAGQYFLGFWKKVFQPLTTAALVLVAVSFIFGPLREATMGSRVFVAICFGLLFIILQRLLNTVSLVYQFDPLVAVLLPVAASAAVGGYLLKRAV